MTTLVQQFPSCNLRRISEGIRAVGVTTLVQQFPSCNAFLDSPFTLDHAGDNTGAAVSLLQPEMPTAMALLVRVTTLVQQFLSCNQEALRLFGIEVDDVTTLVQQFPSCNAHSHAVAAARGNNTGAAVSFLQREAVFGPGHDGRVTTLVQQFPSCNYRPASVWRLSSSGDNTGAAVSFLQRVSPGAQSLPALCDNTGAAVSLLQQGRTGDDGGSSTVTTLVQQFPSCNYGKFRVSSSGKATP